MNYVVGSPTKSSYYKVCNGDDDKLKTKINRLRVSDGRIKFVDAFPLNSLGNWVIEDPQNYCGSAWQELYRRMSDKVLNANEDGLIMADLYYAKSTLELAAVYAKKALKIVRALRKKDVRQIKFYFSKYNSNYTNNRTGKRIYHKALAELPSAWLALSFVYNPLQATFKSFSDVLNNPLIWRQVDLYSGSIHDSYTKVWGFNGDKRLETYKITSRGGAECRFKNPNAHLIQRMGITDLVGTVWDIVPWTWAVDYFVNISSYIRRLNPRFNSIEWSKAWHGFKIHRRTTLLIRDPNLPDNSYSGSSYHRQPGIPESWKFKAQFDLTYDQFANLASAISLTLAGKFSRVKTF